MSTTQIWMFRYVQIKVSSLNQLINSCVLSPGGMTKCGAAECLMHLYSQRTACCHRAYSSHKSAISISDSVSNSLEFLFCCDTIHNHEIDTLSVLYTGIWSDAFMTMSLQLKLVFQYPPYGYPYINPAKSKSIYVNHNRISVPEVSYHPMSHFRLLDVGIR